MPMLEFGILGPLEVTVDGAPVAINGRRQRSLLTVLLLRANETVTKERLVDLLWGEQAPKAAVPALQNAIGQLRRALGDDVIEYRAPGYRLAWEPHQLDLGRFELLVREARDANPADRSRLLGEALALWRGPALADSELE